MKTKTNCKAGHNDSNDKLSANHSETLVRDSGKSLKVKTALWAGATTRIS